MALLNITHLSRGQKLAVPTATLLNEKEFKVLYTGALMTGCGNASQAVWSRSVRLFDWLAETRSLGVSFTADTKDSDSWGNTFPGPLCPVI